MQEQAPRLSRLGILGLNTLIQSLLIALALLGGWWFQNPWWESGFRPKMVASGSVLGLSLALIIIWLYHSGWAGMATLRENLQTLLKALVPAKSNADLLVLSLGAGIGEEIFFRGFLQGTIAMGTGGIAAIIIAAFVFGAMHFVSLSYFIYASILGSLIGCLYHLTGDLYSAIFAHAIFDYVALLWGTRFLLPGLLEEDPCGIEVLPPDDEG